MIECMNCIIVISIQSLYYVWQLNGCYVKNRAFLQHYYQRPNITTQELLLQFRIFVNRITCRQISLAIPKYRVNTIHWWHRSIIAIVCPEIGVSRRREITERSYQSEAVMNFSRWINVWIQVYSTFAKKGSSTVIPLSCKRVAALHATHCAIPQSGTVSDWGMWACRLPLVCRTTTHLALFAHM